MIALLKAAFDFANLQWRAVAAGAAALAVGFAVVVFLHERHARIEAERARDQALAQAAAMQAQTQLDHTAAAADGKAATRAASLTAKAQETAHEIQSSAGADQRLPEAVRSAWRAGLLGVRQSSIGEDAVPDRAGG